MNLLLFRSCNQPQLWMIFIKNHTRILKGKLLLSKAFFLWERYTRSHYVSSFSAQQY